MRLKTAGERASRSEGRSKEIGGYIAEMKTKRAMAFTLKHCKRCCKYSTLKSRIHNHMLAMNGMLYTQSLQSIAS